MAKKGNRQKIKLVNKSTGTFYTSMKNRVNTTTKLEMKKFDPKANNGKGGHVIFKEAKIK